jgi:hypothetical protein
MTGIYRPEWHLNNDRQREAFEKQEPAATWKLIYVSQVIVGSKGASLQDVSPRPDR